MHASSKTRFDAVREGEYPAPDCHGKDEPGTAEHDQHQEPWFPHIGVPGFRGFWEFQGVSGFRGFGVSGFRGQATGVVVGAAPVVSMLRGFGSRRTPRT